MKSQQLTPGIIQTRSGGYHVFIGVVRQGEGGKIVWRSEHLHGMRACAWEDAEQALDKLLADPWAVIAALAARATH